MCVLDILDSNELSRWIVMIVHNNLWILFTVIAYAQLDISTKNHQLDIVYGVGVQTFRIAAVVIFVLVILENTIFHVIDCCVTDDGPFIIHFGNIDFVTTEIQIYWQMLEKCFCCEKWCDFGVCRRFEIGLYRSISKEKSFYWFFHIQTFFDSMVQFHIFFFWIGNFLWMHQGSIVTIISKPFIETITMLKHKLHHNSDLEFNPNGIFTEHICLLVMRTLRKRIKIGLWV